MSFWLCLVSRERLIEIVITDVLKLFGPQRPALVYDYQDSISLECAFNAMIALGRGARTNPKDSLALPLPKQQETCMSARRCANFCSTSKKK